MKGTVEEVEKKLYFPSWIRLGKCVLKMNENTYNENYTYVKEMFKYG
ncbi:hypothetical protein SAMN04487944_10532 [Gracilibacillus ureilyticus]|uniref:Uncharacterized protein n=1 Tax=Gracilibacillus ureilyticus TaxID=531814 RepID=A0A1H9PJT5_9BACI|nr:hypothetical protein SAMN04487944_10532 [Gracilibacillus ureilyticus]